MRVRRVGKVGRGRQGPAHHRAGLRVELYCERGEGLEVVIGGGGPLSF